jgi:hypothetical protein
LETLVDSSEASKGDAPHSSTKDDGEVVTGSVVVVVGSTVVVVGSTVVVVGSTVVVVGSAVVVVVVVFAIAGGAGDW